MCLYTYTVYGGSGSGSDGPPSPRARGSSYSYRHIYMFPCVSYLYVYLLVYIFFHHACVLINIHSARRQWLNTPCVCACVLINVYRALAQRTAGLHNGQWATLAYLWCRWSVHQKTTRSRCAYNMPNGSPPAKSESHGLRVELTYNPSINCAIISRTNKQAQTQTACAVAQPQPTNGGGGGPSGTRGTAGRRISK